MAVDGNEIKDKNTRNKNWDENEKISDDSDFNEDSDDDYSNNKTAMKSFPTNAESFFSDL